MERNALGLIRKGNVIKEGIANIISKDTELQYVRSVELKRHTAHTCPLKDAGTRHSPLGISTLRIVVRDEKTSQEWGKPTCLENRNCPLSRGLTVEKLVVITNTNRNPISLDRFNEGHIADHVLHIEYCRNAYYPQVGYESKAKRLFVILSHLEDAKATFGGSGPRRLALSGMSYMADNLGKSCRFHQSPREVIVVNFGILEKLLDPTTADGKGTFEALCRKSIDRYTPMTYSAVPGQTCRTAARSNAVLKFISLKKYLTEYDWDGVYTPEEVDDLLQGDDGDEE